MYLSHFKFVDVGIRLSFLLVLCVLLQTLKELPALRVFHLLRRQLALKDLLPGLCFEFGQTAVFYTTVHFLGVMLFLTLSANAFVLEADRTAISR
jgi:hypothetical protein